jgi:hypothetical protein
VVAEREDEALLRHVADRAVADGVDVQEHRGARVELLAVTLDPRARAEQQALLGAGKQDPDVEVAQRGAEALGESQHRRDARGVVVRSGHDARQRDVEQ